MIKNRLWKILTLSIVIATGLIMPATAQITPFSAVYDMYRQGDKLGSGERKLTRDSTGEYTLSLKSDLEWLIFSDKRFEKSIFSIEDGRVIPKSFEYKRSGTGKDDKLKIQFEPNKNLVVKPKHKKDPAPDQWQAGWLDEMSMHAQIQLDLKNGQVKFEYQLISNSGRLRSYKFEVIGEELISTGMGRFKAIKVARIYDNKKFYAQHAWFIKELDYTLARLWRMKKGVEQYDLVIKKYTASTLDIKG